MPRRRRYHIAHELSISQLYLRQLEHVVMPGGVIDVEAGIDQLAAVAIVDFGPHDIGQTHWFAAEFRERQRQAALRLVAGVIDDDEMAAAGITGPGIGDEAVRGPVVGPGRLRLDLRPSPLAEPRLFQYRQQLGIKGGDLRVRWLGRTTAEMGRHPYPGTLTLVLMEKAQTGRQEGDHRRRLVL